MGPVMSSLGGYDWDVAHWIRQVVLWQTVEG